MPFGAYVTSRFPVLELVAHLNILQPTDQTD